MSDSATPWTAARQASQSLTSSQSLLKLMSIESVMPSNHLILCRLLVLLPSIFPIIRVFSNESVLHIRWPNYWGSDSLQPHKLQHTRLLCPPLSPGVCSNPCPLHQPSHPLPSSSPFASIRELFSSEYSGLVSFRVDWFDLAVPKGLTRVFCSNTVRKHQFFNAQPSLWFTNTVNKGSRRHLF